MYFSNAGTKPCVSHMAKKLRTTCSGPLLSDAVGPLALFMDFSPA
jgi:hypothetical protein